MKLSRATLPIGLDISGRWLKAMQARYADGARCEAGAHMRVPRGDTSGDGGAEPPWGAKDAQLLAGVLERGNFSGKQAVLVAPRQLLFAEVLELPPRASGAPLEQLARMELARSNRCDEGSFTLGVWDLPTAAGPKSAGQRPQRDPSQPTSVFACGLPHERIEPILQELEHAGVEVVAIDTPGCALARACRPLMRSGGAAPLTAILELGWSSALLVVVCGTAQDGDVVLYERNIAESGLGRLFRAIATRVGAEDAAVELILAEGAGGESEERARAGSLQGEARACVTRFIEGLAPELQRSLSYLAHKYPGWTPASVLLTGDGAELAVGGALCERLAQAMPIPVTRASLSDVVGGMPTGRAGDRASMLGALGASMHALDAAAQSRGGRAERRAAA
jgi:Tfp pilus assembly PilM family ATPase